jgi:hypothetical protein
MKTDLKDIEDVLPEKLSELLLFALADLEAVEEMLDINISMDNWNIREPYNNCSVCHAGAVVVNTFNVRAYLENDIMPSTFRQSISNKLKAMQHFDMRFIKGK